MVRTNSALLILVVLLSVILGSIAAKPYLESPWVQVMGDGVIRTNVSDKVLSTAESAVVEKHQHWIDEGPGKRRDPSYSAGVRGWKTGSSPEDVDAEVNRAHLEITDADGNRLSLVRITSTGSPTLVFVEYAKPGGSEDVTAELVNELSRRGVKKR